jgi:hypothetical protein
MSRRSFRETAEKQIRRSQEASGDYLKGVDSVTESPTKKAVAKKDKLKANWNKAIDDGKWADACEAVSVDEWKKKTKEKGGMRYAAGVEAAKDDIVAFHEEFGSFLDGHMATIDKLPDATPEQRIQKMVANARGIATFKRTQRRR